MAEYADEWTEESGCGEPAESHSFVQNQIMHWNMQQTATTKIPPAFDGTTSWFAYEKAIDEWCDVTDLAEDKRGPALRNRLIGEADIYKDYLDPEQLREAGEGVDYLKRTLRPFFVKGTSHVFLWRFMQIFKAHRGQQDLLRWMGRFGVLVKRLKESWMDCLTTLSMEQIIVHPEYIALMRRAEQNRNGYLDEEEQQQVVQEFLRARRQAHENRFPFNDNLMALVMVVQADLTEQQRERMTSTMVTQGVHVENYTYQGIRQVFTELFCAPKNSWENPSLRGGRTQGRSFCILGDGELDGAYGYWVEDDDSGEQGFLPEVEDVFWTFDEETYAWVSRKLGHRKLRRGRPKGKGKSTGKGKKGYGRFKPSRGKSQGGKGDRSQTLITQQEYTDLCA